MTEISPPRFELYDVTSEDEFADVFPVLKQLAVMEFSEDDQAKITSKKVWLQYMAAQEQGYKLYAVRNNTECLAVFGARIMNDPLNLGKPYLQINNLVVEEDYQGLGIGTDILDRVEMVAKKKKCETVALWSLTSNKKNKSFYETAGYSATSHFMIKDIT